MKFEKFIKPELLILIPVLYIIGFGIKKSKIRDECIPIILGIISIFLSTAWIIATSTIHDEHDIASTIFTGITQGILIAGASVYSNQIYIQSKKSNYFRSKKG